MTELRETGGTPRHGGLIGGQSAGRGLGAFWGRAARASGGDLQLEQDPSGRYLAWLICFLAFFAMIAMAGLVAIATSLGDWDSGLQGHYTLQIPAADDEGARTSEIETATDVLLSRPGVRSVRVLGEDELAGLLEPWLGDQTLDASLRLPTLIAIEAPPGNGFEPAAAWQAVADQVPGATLEDHRDWAEGLIGTAAVLEAVAVLMVATIAGASALAVIFVIRTGLALHRPMIDLLSVLGAEDGYIAGQFERHTLVLALKGALGGLVLSVATLAVIWLSMSRVPEAVRPPLDLSPLEFWPILLVLPGLLLITWATARVTVLGALRRRS